jgi:hypothetical protein
MRSAYWNKNFSEAYASNAYETLKVAASMLAQQNLDLVLYEDGSSDLTFDVTDRDDLNGRRDGDLLLVAGTAGVFEGMDQSRIDDTDYDSIVERDMDYESRVEGLGSACPRDGHGALVALDRLLTDRALEVVMSVDYYCFMIAARAEALVDDAAPTYGDMPVKRQRGPAEIPVNGQSLEDILRGAGVDPSLASLIDHQSGMSSPVETTDEIAEVEPAMGRFSKMVPSEPDIEIDVATLSLDEVIGLLRDPAILGKARRELHERLDKLVVG